MTQAQEIHPRVNVSAVAPSQVLWTGQDSMGGRGRGGDWERWGRGPGSGEGMRWGLGQEQQPVPPSRSRQTLLLGTGLLRNGQPGGLRGGLGLTVAQVWGGARPGPRTRAQHSRLHSCGCRLEAEEVFLGEPGADGGVIWKRRTVTGESWGFPKPLPQLLGKGVLLLWLGPRGTVCLLSCRSLDSSAAS